MRQSSVPRATYDYLASLEWIRSAENVCLVGPAGTGKSHLLVGLGHAAVEAGYRVRYLPAAELVETLYRGMADNSVGRSDRRRCSGLDLVIVDEVGLRASRRHRDPAAASASSPPPTSGRSLGVASHWPFDQWGRFLPEHTTAVSMLDRLLHHAMVVVTEGESYRMKGPIERRIKEEGELRVETFSWPPAETFAWPLTLTTR